MVSMALFVFYICIFILPMYAALLDRASVGKVGEKSLKSIPQYSDMQPVPVPVWKRAKHPHGPSQTHVGLWPLFQRKTFGTAAISSDCFVSCLFELIALKFHVRDKASC